MDFPVTLDPSSNIPIWRQLYAALYDAMASGRLKPGDPMPSTRQLARSLKISRDTVVRTYDDLIAQGFVETAGGTGSFVSRRFAFNPSIVSNRKNSASCEIDRTGDLSDFGRRLTYMELGQSNASDFESLNYGAAPADVVPSKQWSKVLARHCTGSSGSAPAFESEVHGYTRLREALAGYLKRSKALECVPEQIMIFRDGRQPLDLLARILVNPGDAVALENPGYAGAREAFRSMGANIHLIPVDEQGLVTEQLRKVPDKCKLAYVTPSHHDPSGVVLPVKRRMDLLSWARQTGSLIIEDAFDSDYYYGSQAVPALQSMDENDCVIYIYSFWKTLFPLSSISCMVVPKSLVQTFSKAQMLIYGTYCVPDCYTLADFLTESHLERHIRKTREIYTRRRQSLLFSLTQTFKGAASYSKESGGLHVLVRLALEVSDERILRCAAKAGLPMLSTRTYYADQPVAGEFLIPFAAIPEHISGRAVSRLAELLEISGAWRQEDSTTPVCKEHAELSSNGLAVTGENPLLGWPQTA